MFVGFSPGSELLAVTGVLESNDSSDVPVYLYLSACNHFMSSWEWTQDIFDILISHFLSYFLHMVHLPITLPGKTKPLNSWIHAMCVCLYMWFHVPSLLISPKVWACWQKNTDLKVKFLWVWKRGADVYMKEPVCAEASTCCQPSSPSHQTPGNSQWRPLEVRLPPVSCSWAPCSWWRFWYSWTRERKKKKNLEFLSCSYTSEIYGCLLQVVS